MQIRKDFFVVIFSVISLTVNWSNKKCNILIYKFCFLVDEIALRAKVCAFSCSFRS
jgi:hypothetical protein